MIGDKDKGLIKEIRIKIKDKKQMWIGLDA
jgi:hypothetical protein